MRQLEQKLILAKRYLCLFTVLSSTVTFASEEAFNSTVPLTTTSSGLTVQSKGSDIYYTAGQGYESNTDNGAGWCVNGVLTYGGASGSEFYLDYARTEAQLIEDLNVSINGSYTGSSFKGDANASFVRHATTDEASLTFVFGAKYRFQNQIFQLDAVSPLNATGLNAKSLGASSFRAQCGNYFAQQLLLGGSLFFSVRMEFSKITDKATFNAALNAAGVGSAWNFNSAFQSAVNSTGIKGTISVRGIQAGGKPERLGTVLGSTNGTTAPVVNCSFNDVAACAQLITSLTNYVANDFPNQFSGGYSFGSLLGYYFMGYAPAGVLYDLSTSIISSAVQDARNRILAKHKLTNADEYRVSSLLRLMQYGLVDANKYNELSSADSNLTNTLNALNSAGLTCWHDPANCLTAEANANASIVFFDRDILANSRKIASYNDQSGKVTVALFERDAASAQAHWNDFEVQVPSDYVVVGGGGEAKHLPQGNLLTATYPDIQNLAAWYVSSKDHTVSDPVVLKGYVIGMKIAGLTRDQLFKYFYRNKVSSAYASHPSVSISVPSGYQMIGGGIKVNWSGAGNLATATYPISPTTWFAASKDHAYYSPATTDAFILGLPNSIPNIGNVSTQIITGQPVYNHHPIGYADMAPGYALTGCGAFVNWQGAGNLLWEVKPQALGLAGKCESGSKDHLYADPATLYTYALGVKIVP